MEKVYNDIKFSKKFPGSFWGITSFFNSEKYKNKIENYLIFKQGIKKQGLKIIVVECAFKDAPFELTSDDADILIQVRSNSVMWQKERLLNIALQKIPIDCDKIAWLDGDIIFLNNNWVEETSKLLEEYAVCQLFEHAFRLSEKESQAVKNYLGTNFDLDLYLGLNERIRQDSGYESAIYHSLNNKLDIRFHNLGFAWAARREIFSEQGFYDKMILGSGDKIMKNSFSNYKLDQKFTNTLSKELLKDINIWSTAIFSRVKSNVYYTSGKLLHLYHGHSKNKFHQSRYLMIKKYNFKPKEDLKLNEDECFEWASDKKKLHGFVKKYFNIRNDNNNLFRNLANIYIVKINFILNKRWYNIPKMFRALKMYFFLKLDSVFGKIGLIIKKISPSLHSQLKKLLLKITSFTQITEINRTRNLAAFTQIAEIDRSRILTAANKYILEEPITITSFISEKSAGSKHDFFSEADYWWPDPINPKGPYVKMDGLTNPDNFVEHRHVLIRFSIQVSALTAAYLITKDNKYAEQAIKHLRAWFINNKTKMNPNLQFAQAIKGINTGRSIGIIDSIHLVEVAQAVYILKKIKMIKNEEQSIIDKWFSEYLTWLTVSENGLKEMMAKNNHGTCWVMQVAAYARLVNDEKKLFFCQERFKKVLLANQMSNEGSFPLELGRTKPYSYSIFNLDVMTVICQILLNNNLFEFKLSDGRSIKKGIEFMYPFVADKTTWQYPPDIMFHDLFPNRQPFLLFGALAYNEKKYFKLWSILNSDPDNEEVIRNSVIRQPILWINSIHLNR